MQVTLEQGSFSQELYNSTLVNAANIAVVRRIGFQNFMGYEYFVRKVQKQI